VSTYDTVRVSLLQSRVGAAVTELRSLRCSDLAASEALSAVKLAIHTLECWWLPALDELAPRRGDG